MVDAVPVREQAKQVLRTRFYLNYFTRYSGIDSLKFIPNFPFLKMVQYGSDIE